MASSRSEYSTARWFLAAMLFLAAVLNYVDKNALALLATTIQADLDLSDRDYANIQNAFQVAYTLALLGSGFIVDRIGSRISLALFVGWWSVANMVTAAARSAAGFGICRFLLGLGEAGNWTASPKIVSEAFPVKERGLAIGIYTAGTPVGMTLAPFLILSLQERFGWQAAFLVTGGLGLAWMLPWLWVGGVGRFDGGESTPVAVPSPPACAEEDAGWSMIGALTRAEVWCLMLGRMLSDPVWYFYQTWYPKYLVTARGLEQADVRMTWVMFLCAGLGSIFGGWLAGHWIRKGHSPPRVRLAIMACCAVFMPLSPLVAYAPSTRGSLAIASLMVFLHLAWLTNISALVVDLVPKRSLGVVFGIVAAGSSAGAIAMNDFVARLLQPDPVTKAVAAGAYTHWYLVAAGLHLAALPLVAWAALRHRRPT